MRDNLVNGFAAFIILWAIFTPVILVLHAMGLIK
jgi:hypothetical protein